MDPGDLGPPDDFCYRDCDIHPLIALASLFPPSILLVLDSDMMYIYYILLTTFVTQPFRSMTEPRFASYTSPTSCVIYNEKT